MNIKVFLVVIFSIGILSSCKKGSEPGKDWAHIDPAPTPVESGFYLMLKRDGKTYVLNENKTDIYHYLFDAYFDIRSASLLLNVSKGFAEVNKPFSFNILIRSNVVEGTYIISHESMNGNNFSFVQENRALQAGQSKDKTNMRVTITNHNFEKKIIEGTFKGLANESFDGLPPADSGLVAIEGSFRLRLVEYPVLSTTVI